MKRPVIAITSEIINLGIDFHPSHRMISLNEDYKNIIENRGGVPIIIPITSDFELIDYYIDMCDGFLFTGGADINPIFYGENPDHSLGMLDNARDMFEIEFMKRVLEKDRPMLGICRGMQILNISLGGSLIQHIPDIDGSFNHMGKGNKFDISHSVNFYRDNLFYDIFGEKLYVNSSHHQAIGDLGQGIDILGLSDDNIIEAVGLGGYKFVYGLQWHPEGLVYRDETMNNLIDRFLDACR